MAIYDGIPVEVVAMTDGLDTMEDLRVQQAPEYVQCCKPLIAEHFRTN